MTRGETALEGGGGQRHFIAGPWASAGQLVRITNAWPECSPPRASRRHDSWVGSRPSAASRGKKTAICRPCRAGARTGASPVGQVYAGPLARHARERERRGARVDERMVSPPSSSHMSPRSRKAVTPKRRPADDRMHWILSALASWSAGIIRQAREYSSCFRHSPAASSPHPMRRKRPARPEQRYRQLGLVFAAWRVELGVKTMLPAAAACGAGTLSSVGWAPPCARRRPFISHGLPTCVRPSECGVRDGPTCELPAGRRSESPLVIGGAPRG